MICAVNGSLMGFDITLSYVDDYFSGEVSSSIISDKNLMFTWLNKACVNKNFILDFAFPLHLEAQIFLVSRLGYLST